ncbi:aspartic and glutamic acid-rich protein [Cyclospora cayetanensis]|uniref:Aspartic and glutamic acid-rich protein n=1 Tax=Cyclospora cayetanensis TaxID=88456 RepID=A0A6P6RYP9_9EIME|nr:aspartic and glutamic acid-rich protein [Cyclospora cayetanensis]
MSDFRLYGEGGHRLLSNLSGALGIKADQLHKTEGAFPSPEEEALYEASLHEGALQGGPSFAQLEDSEDEVESAENASFIENHENAEAEEDGETEIEDEELEPEGIDDEYFDETPASFLEEGEDADEETEEDWGYAELEDAEEEEIPESVSADPYGVASAEERAGQTKSAFSFAEGSADEADAPMEEEDTELPEENDEAQDESSASFIEEPEAEDDAEEMPVSLLQIHANKRSIKLHEHTKETPFAFAETLSPLQATDQTAAEDAMLKESNEGINSGEAGRNAYETAEEAPQGKDGRVGHALGLRAWSQESSDSFAPARGEEPLGVPGNENASEEGNTVAQPGDEQQEDDYQGPADPLIKYGGNATDDVEAIEEENAIGGPAGAGIGAGEGSQLRTEEAGDENEDLPLATEDDLATDLQGSFPKIQAPQPHDVQRRHVDQDIKLTEKHCRGVLLAVARGQKLKAYTPASVDTPGPGTSDLLQCLLFCWAAENSWLADGPAAYTPQIATPCYAGKGRRQMAYAGY